MGKLFKALIVLVLALGALAAGAWWSLRRPDIPYATLEKTYADPASRYQDLPGGVRVRYRDQGDPDGPVIVLVHGFFASLDTWDAWVADLGKDHRIVTLDLPGHGLSRAPAGWPMSIDSYVTLIEAFAAARGLEKFVLAGSSMGGNVAWEYALAHPERTRGLILVAASGWPSNADNEARRRRLALLANPIGRATLRDLDASSEIRQGLQAAYARPGAFSEATLQRYLDYHRAPGRRDAVIDLMLSHEDRKPASRERLALIGVPSLVLHGAKDVLTPPAHGRRFAESIPGARLILYPDAGHVVQEEAAQASAADVRAFTASLEPKPAPPVDDNQGRAAVEARDPNAVIFY